MWKTQGISVQNAVKKDLKKLFAENVDTSGKIKRLFLNSALNVESRSTVTIICNNTGGS